MAKLTFYRNTGRYLRFLSELVRWPEWYDSKLPLISLTALYIIWAKSLDPSVALPAFAIVLVFVILFLAFGYLINDISDWNVDIRAGKRRGIHKLTNFWAWTIAIILGGIGVISLIGYYDHPYVIVLIVSSYGLAIVYSLPPFRLKERGWAGLISGSAAQRSLPVLVTAAVFEYFTWEIWLLAGLFLLVGLRWILMHQIMDYKNDLDTGVRTYATQTNHSQKLIHLQTIIFSLEIVCLAVIWGYLSWQTPVFLFIGITYLIYLILLYREYRKVGFRVSLVSYNYIPVADLYLVVWPISLACYLGLQNLAYLSFVGLEIIWKWSCIRKQAFSFTISRLKAAFSIHNIPQGGISRYEESLQTKQRTNIAGMTFLDNIDEVTLGLFREDSHQVPEMQFAEYRANLKKSFDTDIPLVTPKYALLKVTNRCNSRCTYCSHGQGTPVHNEPSTEELTRVIHQMAELGVKSVNFSGGEATMRRDLPELITATKRLKLVPILLTNGLLLSKQRSALVKVGIDYIIISLDSLSQDVYQLQRGVPLQGALNGVEAALQMRKEDNPDLVIGVTSVVTRHNLKQLPAILEWLTERRISLQITPYHHFDQSTDDCLSPQNEDELRSVIAKLIKMRDNGYLLCNSLAYLRWIPDYVLKRELPDDYRCYVGYTGVFVDADLNLRPCWSWSIPVVANLRTENLVDAWQLDAFKKGRQQIHKLNCSKCWLLCTSEFSLRFLEKHR